MDFSIKIEDNFVVITLKPGSPNEILSECTGSYLSEPDNILVIDFSKIEKLDHASLTQLESAVQIVTKAGRKVAFCSINASVRPVLEVTDMLSNAVVFDSFKEIKKNVQKYQSGNKIKQPVRATLPSGTNNHEFRNTSLMIMTIAVLFLSVTTLISTLVFSVKHSDSIQKIRADISIIKINQDSILQNQNRVKQEEELLLELE